MSCLYNPLAGYRDPQLLYLNIYEWTWAHNSFVRDKAWDTVNKYTSKGLTVVELLWIERVERERNRRRGAGERNDKSWRERYQSSSCSRFTILVWWSVIAIDIGRTIATNNGIHIQRKGEWETKRLDESVQQKTEAICGWATPRLVLINLAATRSHPLDSRFSSFAHSSFVIRNFKRCSEIRVEVCQQWVVQLQCLL